MDQRPIWLVLFGSLFCILLYVPQAFSGIAVVNGLTHEYNVSPGKAYRGSIEIQNSGTNTQYVRLYKKDYLFYARGEILYDDPTSHNRSNAEWIDINDTYIAVPAGLSLNIQYEINIPLSDSIVGSYWSVIMVEGVNDIDTTTANKGVNIQSVMRYAIQLITNIEESGKRDLKFKNVELLTENNSSYLQVDLHNTGERYLRPALKLELFNENGQNAGNFQAQMRKIYPTTSVRMRIEIDSIPPGQYQALLIADSKDEDAFGMNLSLEFKDD